MTLDEWQKVALLAQFGMTALGGVGLYYLRSAFVTRRGYDRDKKLVELQILQAQQRLDRGEDRFRALTDRIGGLPSREDLHKLDLSMTALNGELRVLHSELKGHRELTERLEAAVTRHESIFSEGSR